MCPTAFKTPRRGNEMKGSESENENWNPAATGRERQKHSGCSLKGVALPRNVALCFLKMQIPMPTQSICLHTFALVAALVSISELQSFIDTCGCSAGHCSPEQTWKTDEESETERVVHKAQRERPWFGDIAWPFNTHTQRWRLRDQHFNIFSLLSRLTKTCIWHFCF